MSVGDFVIDHANARLIGPGGSVNLGRNALKLLLMLCDTPGRLVTRDAIIEHVWGGGQISDSALTSTIKELRRALADNPRTPRYIESVYGRGYRLIALVGQASASSVEPTGAGNSVGPCSDPTADPPIVVISEFNDSAIATEFPHLGAILKEEILFSLAQFRDLQLIANPRFDERRPQVSDPRRSYHLSGTLLRSLSGTRFIARLRNVSNGRIAWSETMELAVVGAAEGVDRIVRRIAASVLPAVNQDVIATVGDHGRGLFDRYLLARRASFACRACAEARDAADQLEAIIAEMPEFYLAYGPLVRLYNTDFYFTSCGASAGALRARALDLAVQAIATEPQHCLSLVALGFCRLYAGQFDHAVECFERALANNPYCPERINQVATGMVYLGRFDRARELFAICHDLQQWIDDDGYEQEGRLHLLAGNDEVACACFGAMTEPSFWSEFYRALCERNLSKAEGNARLDRWRSRVERSWHSGVRPTDGEIMAMIRSHHPFRQHHGDRLFTLAEQAILTAEATGSPRSFTNL